MTRPSPFALVICLLLMAGGSVAPCWAEDCDYWEFDHYEHQTTFVCTFDSISGEHCWSHTYLTTVYSCVDLPDPPPPPPPSDPPSDPPPPPENPKDQDRDGVMDCWTADLDSTNPSKDALDTNQKLGSDYLGPNTIRPNHTGIDEDCNLGDSVYATHAGRVLEAENRGGEAGIIVRILDDDGTYSAFAHLQKYLVTTGARVGVGTLIGRCNSSGTGGEQGNHLHYEVQCPATNNSFLDPTIVHPCQSQR